MGLNRGGKRDSLSLFLPGFRPIFRAEQEESRDRTITSYKRWYKHIRDFTLQVGRYNLFVSKKHASPNKTQLVSMEGVFIYTACLYFHGGRVYIIQDS